MVGPSPILAEGPGHSFLPFLTVACCWWWWEVPRQSCLRALGAVPCRSWLGPVVGGGRWSLSNRGGGSRLQFPAIPGWNLLLVLVGGPCPIPAEGPGRSSPLLLAGACCWCWPVVPPQSWLRTLGAVSRHSCLGPVVAGGGLSLSNAKLAFHRKQLSIDSLCHCKSPCGYFFHPILTLVSNFLLHRPSSGPSTATWCTYY